MDFTSDLPLPCIDTRRTVPYITSTFYAFHNQHRQSVDAPYILRSFLTMAWSTVMSTPLPTGRATFHGLTSCELLKEVFDLCAMDSGGK